MDGSNPHYNPHGNEGHVANNMNGAPHRIILMPMPFILLRTTTIRLHRGGIMDTCNSSNNTLCLNPSTIIPQPTATTAITEIHWGRIIPINLPRI
jgi:hypothetical protein